MKAIITGILGFIAGATTFKVADKYVLPKLKGYREKLERYNEILEGMLETEGLEKATPEMRAAAWKLAEAKPKKKADEEKGLKEQITEFIASFKELIRPGRKEEKEEEALAAHEESYKCKGGKKKNTKKGGKK